MVNKLCAPLLLAVAVGWGVPAAASAIAPPPEYESSEPADGERLHRPPSEVTITFSEPIDPSSTMKVLDECGRVVDDRRPTVTLNEISVKLAWTPSGDYRVEYEAKSVPSGLAGTAEGSFRFSVHAGRPCEPAGSPASHGNHGGGERGGGQARTGQGGGVEHGSEASQHGGAAAGADPSQHTSSQHAAGQDMTPGAAQTTRHGMRHTAGTPREPANGGGRPGPASDPTASRALPPVAAPGEISTSISLQAAAIALALTLLIGAGGGLIVRSAGE